MNEILVVNEFIFRRELKVSIDVTMCVAVLSFGDHEMLVTCGLAQDDLVSEQRLLGMERPFRSRRQPVETGQDTDADQNLRSQRPLHRFAKEIEAEGGRRQRRQA